MGVKMKQRDLFPRIPSKPKKGKKDVTIREYQVPSFSSDQVYTVRNEGSKWTCTCPSYLKQRKQCRHIVFQKQKLGLVKPDSSGWKSGVQKALRRGSLPLLKLSFGMLWELDKAWLKWRMAILCGEESERFVGMSGRISEREDAWRLLVSMAISPKSKESEGLRICSHIILEEGWRAEDFVSGERLFQLKAWMDVQARIDWDGKHMEEFWSSFQASSSYARETITTCKKRFSRWGMIGDRELMVTVGFLASTTEWTEPEMAVVPKEGEVESMESLPYYVFDRHTAIGKVVYYRIRKMFPKKKEGDYWGDDLIFNMQSAFCDRLAPGSFWWPLMLRMLWQKYNKTPQEAERDWAEWSKKVKEMTEKAMKCLSLKRS